MADQESGKTRIQPDTTKRLPLWPLAVVMLVATPLLLLRSLPPSRFGGQAARPVLASPCANFTHLPPTGPDLRMTRFSKPKCIALALQPGQVSRTIRLSVDGQMILWKFGGGCNTVRVLDGDSPGPRSMCGQENIHYEGRVLRALRAEAGKEATVFHIWQE